MSIIDVDKPISEAIEVPFLADGEYEAKIVGAEFKEDEEKGYAAVILTWELRVPDPDTGEIMVENQDQFLGIGYADKKRAEQLKNIIAMNKQMLQALFEKAGMPNASLREGVEHLATYGLEAVVKVSNTESGGKMYTNITPVG